METSTKNIKVSKNNAAGINFYNYARKILSLNDLEDLHGAASEKQIQKDFK